jgi:hypothetical protein
MVILLPSPLCIVVVFLLASNYLKPSVDRAVASVLANTSSHQWPAVWPAASSVLRHFLTAVWREFNHNSFENFDHFAKFLLALRLLILFPFLLIVALPPPAIFQVLYAALASARDGGKYGSAVGAPVVQSASVGC